MRIKYITNVRIPTGRAYGYAIMKMCSEFAKTGLETELFVPSKDNNENKQDPFEFYSLDRNFKINRVKSFDLLGKTERFGGIFYWIDIFSFLLNVRLKVKLDNNDVLYTRDFLTALFFSNKNFICLELHAIPKSKLLFGLAIKKVRRFIVLTNKIKDVLINLGVSNENILVSPSGVDLEEYNASANDIEIKGIEANDFVFGYIGTLKTMGMEKGVKLGLESLKFLPDDYKFLIVGGGGDDLLYYKNMSDDLDVSNRTIFIGEVPHSVTYSYSKKCDVLIVPFPENEHYSFFMSPLKIFEYMASKKPIIATNLPSIREILTDGENAILTHPDDPQALANAIINLRENPDLGIKIVENAFNVVSQKYTWRKRAENIIKFIHP